MVESAESACAHMLQRGEGEADARALAVYIRLTPFERWQQQQLLSRGPSRLNGLCIYNYGVAYKQECTRARERRARAGLGNIGGKERDAY